MRRGYLLAEALCALALAALLAVAAGVSLTGARRALRAAESRDVATRAAREAVTITRRALGTGDAIVPRGDTAVDLDLHLGNAVVCEKEPWAILVPPLPQTDTAALTQLPQLPTPEDLVAVRIDATGPDEEWWFASVDSVQLRLDPGVCGVLDGWRDHSEAARPLLRLVLSDTVPGRVTLGAPVRVARRGRLALYHVGRGVWALGFRRCHPWLAICGPIQPVVAPLRSPSAGGFRLGADSVDRRWTISARGHGGIGTAEASVPWR